MRREQEAPQDPDLEASRREREVIGNEKNVVQAEVLSLADTKKKLLADIETAKTDLQTELERRDAQDGEKLKMLDTLIDNKRAEFKQVIADVESAKVEHDSWIEAGKIAQDFNIARNKERIQLEADVANLVKEKTEVESNLSVGNEQIGILDNQGVSLESEISVLQGKKDSLSKEVVTLTTEVSDLEVSILSLKDTEQEIQKNIAELKISIEGKNTEFVEASTKLVDIKNEISGQEELFAKKDEEMNEKAKNLSLLEQRVDERIDLLKRYKEKFTVDELSRMKINIDKV